MNLCCQRGIPIKIFSFFFVRSSDKLVDWMGWRIRNVYWGKRKRSICVYFVEDLFLMKLCNSLDN